MSGRDLASSSSVGGFGGLFAAKFLRRADVDITLIERNNHHLFQPLLYQVATGILSPGEVAPPLREVLKKHDNVTVELGEVTGFDLAARTVRVQHPVSSSDLPYDYLIVGIGVGGSYFGHDEFAPYAPGDEDDRRRPGAAHARSSGPSRWPS